MSAARPKIDRARLLQLAHDLPALSISWFRRSFVSSTMRPTRLYCSFIGPVDVTPRCACWRVKTGRYPTDMAPTAVEALRKLAGHWPDRELAVSLNRMRCKTSDGETWTTVRVREMRERLGIAEYDPAKADDQMISLMKAASWLGICVGSAKSLVLRGILPATQIMPGSPWMVPVEALTSQAVRIGVQRVIDRRPIFYEQYQYDKVIRLPGIDKGVHMKRCGSLIKIFWHDGIGMSLYARRLERSRFVWPSAAAGVVSISSGGTAGGAPPDGQPLLPRVELDFSDAADRVLHAARLYQAGKVKRRIVAAGNIAGWPAVKPEAELIKELLQEWGVPDTGIETVGASTNTYENALEIREIWSKKRFSSGLLVTSAAACDGSFPACRYLSCRLHDGRECC